MSERDQEPTPKRLRDARRRGEAPSGRDLPAAAALAAGLAALGATGPGLAADLAALLRRALALAEVAPAAALSEAGGLALRLALVPALAAGGAAALAGGLQASFLFSPSAAAPRFERIDPLRGLRRLCSAAALGQIGLGLAKALLLGALAATWLADALPALAVLPRAGAAALWRLPAPILGLAWRLALAFLAFGAADALLARRRHLRQLRMTREEVQREGKEDDGDPRHRQERRRLHRAALEAGPVARATVLVVNPTRLAIALHHDRRGDGAPRVLAKGAGREATRLRSAARRAGVPIVRDLPLARALFRLAEVGDELPEELYDAAAAVLAHLYAERPVQEATP